MLKNKINNVSNCLRQKIMSAGSKLIKSKPSRKIIATTTGDVNIATDFTPLRPTHLKLM